MKLEAICTGKTREIADNGEKVSTGIFKEVISGSVFVTKTGIMGDQQANRKVHGGINKAVYAYPSEHFKFWKEKRSDLDFYPGVFRENLSTSGMDEAEVFVGDVFQMGDVTLSVTTPRMPCKKLGLKMKDKGFIKEFLAEERTGFYFKVLEEGEITAGVEIRKVGEDGYGLSIRELVQLHTTRKDDRGLLRKAVNAPSLLDDWRSGFAKKLQS